MTEAWSRLGQRWQEGGPVWCGKERPMMLCRHRERVRDSTVTQSCTARGELLRGLSRPARWPGVGSDAPFFVRGGAGAQRPRVGQVSSQGHVRPSAAYLLLARRWEQRILGRVRLRRTMLTRRGLLLAALLSQGSALLTGIAARRGTVNVQANLVGTARLFLSDIALKVQQQLDPDLELYKLPQRDLLRVEQDIYTIAQAFPEKTRAQFIGEPFDRTFGIAQATADRRAHPCRA